MTSDSTRAPEETGLYRKGSVWIPAKTAPKLDGAIVLLEPPTYGFFRAVFASGNVGRVREGVEYVRLADDAATAALRGFAPAAKGTLEGLGICSTCGYALSSRGYFCTNAACPGANSRVSSQPSKAAPSRNWDGSPKSGSVWTREPQPPGFYNYLLVDGDTGHWFGDGHWSHPQDRYSTTEVEAAEVVRRAGLRPMSFEEAATLMKEPPTPNLIVKRWNELNSRRIERSGAALGRDGVAGAGSTTQKHVDSLRGRALDAFCRQYDIWRRGSEESDDELRARAHAELHPPISALPPPAWRLAVDGCEKCKKLALPEFPTEVDQLCLPCRLARARQNREHYRVAAYQRRLLVDRHASRHEELSPAGWRAAVLCLAELPNTEIRKAGRAADILATYKTGIRKYLEHASTLDRGADGISKCGAQAAAPLAAFVLQAYVRAAASDPVHGRK